MTHELKATIKEVIPASYLRYSVHDFSKDTYVHTGNETDKILPSSAYTAFKTWHHKVHGDSPMPASGAFHAQFSRIWGQPRHGSYAEIKARTTI